MPYALNDTLTNLLLMLARVTLGAFFLIAGLFKIGTQEMLVGYMASRGVPAVLYWPVIALEVVCGLGLILGFQTRLAALGIAAFAALAGLIFHFNLADAQAPFFRNLAIAGAGLGIIASGPGAWSLDHMLRRG